MENFTDRPAMSFTAVYLKDKYGYVGFVEELPGVNSHGQTIDEARENLRHLAALVFDEERAQSAELLKGRDVVREQFRVPLSAR
jgi:predicted RNase H-like HicB family nuclease